MSQQLSINQAGDSGTLVIISDPGFLADLTALAAELGAREGMTTNGEIRTLPPAESAIPDE